MDIQQIISSLAMPLNSPYFYSGPHEFRNREYFIISYLTDMAALKKVIPYPLEIDMDYGPIVKFEFIKMPDSNVFGSYTEAGQVVPVVLNGQKGIFVQSMFLDGVSPIAGGREIWGFPKKFAQPSLRIDSIVKDCLIGQLKYGELEVARAVMGYKWQVVDKEKIKQALAVDNYMVKIIPDVDCRPRICELMKYNLVNVIVKEAWTGPTSLELFQHALAPVAALPIKEIVDSVHFVCDLTISNGKTVLNYLENS